MKTSYLFSEAIKNLGPKHLVFGLLATIVLCGSALGTVHVGADALEQERSFQQRGGNVWLVQSVSPAGISASECEALATSSGVSASGGIVGSVRSEFRVHPNLQALSVLDVTPGLGKVWLSQDISGVWLGNELADLGQGAPGHRLFTEGGESVEIGGVLPEALPVGSLNSSLVRVVPPAGNVAECHVAMSPGSFHLGTSLVGAAFSDQVRAQPYLERPAGVLTGAERWHQWIDLKPWAIAAGILSVIFLLLSITRRSEIGIYRLLGAPPLHIWLLTILEAIVLMIFAASITATVVQLYVYARFGPEPELVTLTVRHVMLSVVIAIPASALLTKIVSSGNILEALKDR